MEKGYFLCADILGFSSIIKNNTSFFIEQKMNSWIALIEKLITKYHLEKYQVLSDTLFIAVKDRIEDLLTLIKFSRELLNESISISLPVRGTISFGEYFWGKLVYGPSVIAGHELEKRQNWIGICLASNIVVDFKEYSGFVVCYPVPMFKNDEIKLYYAISWDVPSFEDLTSLTTRDGLGGVPGVGKPLDWDWGDKISNTVIFGLYLQALKNCKKTGEKFQGHHPVHFIDLTLRKIDNST